MDFDRVLNTITAQENRYPIRIEMNRRTINMFARAEGNYQMPLNKMGNDTDGIIAIYTGVPIYDDETLADGYTRVTVPHGNTNDMITVQIGGTITFDPYELTDTQTETEENVDIKDEDFLKVLKSA